MKYIIAIIILFFTSCEYYDIKEHKAITKAVVVDFGNTRSGAFLIYKYNVAGKEYEGTHGARFSGKCLRRFRDKEFILLYSSKNPSKSYMLVTRWDFDKWDLQFPDSLRWVEDCFP